jgi:hypothetical protein
MLGHAKAWMTLDVYAERFDDDLDRVAANLDAAIRSAGYPLRTVRPEKHYASEALNFCLAGVSPEELRVELRGLEPTVNLRKPASSCGNPRPWPAPTAAHAAVTRRRRASSAADKPSDMLSCTSTASCTWVRPTGRSACSISWASAPEAIRCLLWLEPTRGESRGLVNHWPVQAVRDGKPAVGANRVAGNAHVNRLRPIQRAVR